MKKRYVVVLALALLLAVTSVAFAVAPSAPDAPVGSAGVGVAMLRLHISSHVADPVCPPPGMGSCGGG